jgi:membrane-associated phospholipid phosphatase
MCLNAASSLADTSRQLQAPLLAPAAPTESWSLPGDQPLAEPTAPPRDDLDAATAILPSAWVTALVALVSMGIVGSLDLGKQPIRLAYLEAAIAILPPVMVLWAATILVRTIATGNRQPMREMAHQLRYHAPMLVLPLLVFPLFLAAFTIAKSSIGFLVGFRWDPTLARIDVALLGTDAWRLTHRWIGPDATVALEAVYAIVWGVALAFVAPLVAMLASLRLAGRFFLAMILTWTVGGLICATLFASAGPVFAQLSDATLGRHFALLQAALAQSLPPGSMIRESQEYLRSAAPYHYVVKGGGISAMPSMHVGTAAIYVLASRRSLLLAPALLFWALVMIASVHFGYHYLIDGITATLIAAACWRVSGWYLARAKPA